MDPSVEALGEWRAIILINRAYQLAQAAVYMSCSSSVGLSDFLNSLTSMCNQCKFGRVLKGVTLFESF